MTTEKNDTAEGESVGFFYFPVSPKDFLKLQEVCRKILHPHGSEEPLTKEQYMKTLTDLGETCYNGMTGDHLKEAVHSQAGNVSEPTGMTDCIQRLKAVGYRLLQAENKNKQDHWKQEHLEQDEINVLTIYFEKNTGYSWEDDPKAQWLLKATSEQAINWYIRKGSEMGYN